MKMKIIVVTLFPQLIEDCLKWGIPAQAANKGLIALEYVNPRDFADNKHGHVDDRPYGGGQGMVLKYQPLRDAILAAKEKLPQASVCYLCPQGKPFDQASAWQFSADKNGIIFVCGRYEGIDQRIIDRWIDEKISIGPYVLSGGELACAVVIEACARLLPGAVGDSRSVQQESHSDWAQYDHPHYTRPEVIDGMAVPRVLLSGDHTAIEEWRKTMREKLGRAASRDDSGSQEDGVD